MAKQVQMIIILDGVEYKGVPIDGNVDQSTEELEGLPRFWLRMPTSL